MQATRLVVVSALLAAFAPAARAQDALTRLGLTPASAGSLANSVVTGRIQSGMNVDDAARKLFKALPPSARAAVTTGMWAWTKSYLSSAAFKAEYAKQRTAATPTQPTFKGTINDEIKAETNKAMASINETRKLLPQLPPEQRTAIEASIKQQEAMVKSAQYASMMKMSVEAQRASARSNYDEEMKRWATNWPADPQPIIAKRLRDYLAICADVNFAAKTVLVNSVPTFENPAYERKPGQWKECYRAGREAHAAGRTAASAWLKEIGG